ncbi:aryl-sulfate sulfotransferase [Desulforamulus aeronauticus]|uniref:Arylsulfotransferase (ASST) n=1 Tax=Desulforamulus aeronauticus DSM 10349 TaxID=1121421 RepID=A0A1M6SHL1_9FIRM|nr:aryl-sulfate sulfotransferase [Desulforamulus aeronauticus]SHK44231.1 Arylsulfotransferase (ASST) [Desulforamulus aeronauticus DSM 10349]
MTYPSIYPTGVTIYNPEKCWNGYTIFQVEDLGALLINMNGGEVKLWKNLHGFPNKLLPGGQVFGHTGERNIAFSVQDGIDLIQVDWDGNIVWKFNQYEFIEDPGEQPQWMARQHHDFQRAGNPVGYYVPGMEPQVDKGNTLILCHKNLVNPKISDKLLADDTIIEVDWEGNIVWEWVCSDHFDEYGFREDAKNILARDPNMRTAGPGMGDWMHINSMSVLGPNKWYDAGDERFHPENIIWDAREANIIAIISKQTGKVVWKVGPYYDTSEELKKLGWIIGQHHAHMIPRGLPGEGNILVFDNGGWAGYGAPNPSSPTGAKNALRDYSRVLEFDPTTLEIIWQYTPSEAGYLHPVDSNRFYSPFISGAQRLPNGNTLITEGSGGRLIEVTPDHEIVWEYISPYWGKAFPMNMIYRAYRVPYEWVPQLEFPQEVPIQRIDVTTFRVPGAEPCGCSNVTEVAGVLPYQADNTLCVAAGDEFDDKQKE